MSATRAQVDHEVIVIGSGQSGLAASYHLTRAAVDHVVLERDARVGDVWRARYDSLRLYSPARYDELPGHAFPIDPLDFPTGREMADYLEAYVARFELPVRTGVTVERLTIDPDGGHVVETGSTTYRAANVVLATGPFQQPFTPAVASELEPGIRQVHSADYRSPEDLPEGPVLVVGASHSGADIAYELAASRPTILAGRSHGQLPFSVESGIARVSWPLMAAIARNVLSFRTPIGRRMAPKVRMGGGPLLRHRRKDLVAAGVEWVEQRIVAATEGKPTLEDGRVLDVASVVWCTGFRPDLSWIEPDISGPDGWPEQERGVIASVPGLYILGLPFLHSFASMLVLGAADDAAHVVERMIAERRPATVLAAA